MTLGPYLAGLLLPLLLAGGPLTLLVAGCLLIPLAWAILARRPPASELAHAPSRHDRLWVRILGGAALGEVSVYLATGLLVLAATGSILPLLVPFVLPAPILLGTLLGAFAGAASADRHWRASGVVAYLGLGFLSLGFVEYAAVILQGAAIGPVWALASFLLVTELFGLVLLLLYQFYALEFLAGRLAVPAPKTRAAPVGGWPRVAVQVACYDEPYALVERCLRSIRALDYPADRLVIQLLDDSGAGAAQGPLATLCRELGIEYRHRTHRRGFKAGALNDGTAALAPDVPFVAIVDADYTVDPSFLQATVPLFVDPSIAWVQTPQSYRNESESAFTRLYSLADAYFYHVIQRVRAAADSSIFCGTMGVLRREAVRAVGGWDEGCITEDAELSLRLYAAGWRSVYLPTVLGSGLAPDRFPVLRSQFSRWAFGGLQMLRRDLLALRSSKLSGRQRLDFWASGAFWMDGAFLLAMAAGLVALLIASWTGLAWPMPRFTLLVGISLAPILLVADGIVKTRLALGRVRPLGLRDAIGVMGFWYALKVTNLRASLRGLSGRSMPFRRTPKTADPTSPAGWFTLLRPTAVEIALAAGMTLAALFAAIVAPPSSLTAGFGRILLIGWLGYYAITFGAAPLLSLVAGPKGPPPPRERSERSVPPSQS
jgi:cellulose synthase/poly-beta-1,6-N-acetylglucosamine synthase-like glycosyltransferase